MDFKQEQSECGGNEEREHERENMTVRASRIIMAMDSKTLTYKHLDFCVLKKTIHKKKPTYQIFK